MNENLIKFCSKCALEQYNLARCIEALMMAKMEVKERPVQEAHIDDLLSEYTERLIGLSGIYN